VQRLGGQAIRDLGAPSFRIDFGDSQLLDLSEQEDYEFPHPIQRWVMPVLILRQTRDGQLTEARVMGTCFTIAPWLAVTARHVLVDDLGGSGEWPEGVGVGAVYVTDEPLPGQSRSWGGVLYVDKVVMNADHDLALLRFRAFKVNGRDLRFSTAPLTIDPPELGTTVLALGYSDSSSAFRPPNTIELHQKMRASRGKVEELHVPRRDSVVLNFPAFTGDYPSPGGMSGGPVLTTTGHVCAIVCRALGPSLDDDLRTSSAALIAFLFTMEVELVLDGVLGIYSVHELAEREVVPTDGSHRKLEFNKRDDGKIDFSWRM
jgi:hypothetical protein